MSEEIKSHLFAIRTTGGQEKVVMRLLEAKANANQINIQSVLLVDNLKGYVVIEAINPSDAYMAVEGVRHIRGQLRGELTYNEIDKYLIKKSTVSELAVEKLLYLPLSTNPIDGLNSFPFIVLVDIIDWSEVLFASCFSKSESFSSS